MSNNSLFQEAAEAATNAIHFDKIGHKQAAIYFYLEAANLLERATADTTSRPPEVTNHITQYKSRADALKCLESPTNDDAIKPAGGQSELSRANFLLIEGLELDENKQNEEAIQCYTTAVELCLQAAKGCDAATATNLRKLADQALTRAEALKQTGNNQENKNETGISSEDFSESLQITEVQVMSNNSSLQISGNKGYSKEELIVLKVTSTINKIDYVPFLSVDLKEKFAYSIPFTDKDGRLILSPKQKLNFVEWRRPEQISNNPKMIEVIDCFSIKQTCVSDCSFVASMAISALYEKRFKKRIITDIIFPKNKKGEPVYNPCGKYMIRLHINGIARKIIVDDLLPVGKHNELLCSFSSNKNEFWISLVEKAYLKVMGGYNFPGSNSNIDLYALTGWIPERVAINDPDTDKEATFKKIFDRFHKGDVLVTVATGEMSDATASRAGLVSTHAYALLDIKEVKGKKLILLKNPWSHLRWRGNFSELDSKNWTPEMCRLLNYDPKSAQMFDNGVFWIDYNSLCNFYDVIYMNWNPSLFNYTYCTHQMWKAGVGPVKDLYNIGDNPQYCLTVENGGAVWILLTRHITDLVDFKDNKEYITLLVYKTGGNKIYYPFDPPPYIDGVRINSPHYLCKMVVKEKNKQKYTLVVSQYEKLHTIYYSLRVYSTSPFTLTKIQNLCKYKQELTGNWAGELTGGCGNHPTHMNNPIYQFRIEQDVACVKIELKAPKQVQIGFDIRCIEAKNTESKNYFSKKSSGNYRSGYVILELYDLCTGVYNIVPSTFYPKTEAPYFLNIFSSVPVKISRLK